MLMALYACAKELPWLENIYSWNQLTLSSIPVNLLLKWAIQQILSLLVLYLRCWSTLLRRNKACFHWKREKLLPIRIAEKPGRLFLAALEREAPRTALWDGKKLYLVTSLSQLSLSNPRGQKHGDFHCQVPVVECVFIREPLPLFMYFGTSWFTNLILK